MVARGSGFTPSKIAEFLAFHIFQHIKLARVFSDDLERHPTIIIETTKQKMILSCLQMGESLEVIQPGGSYMGTEEAGMLHRLKISTTNGTIRRFNTLPMKNIFSRSQGTIYCSPDEIPYFRRDFHMPYTFPEGRRHTTRKRTICLIGIFPLGRYQNMIYRFNSRNAIFAIMPH